MFYEGFHVKAQNDKAQISSAYKSLADAKSKKIYSDLLKFRQTLSPVHLPDPSEDQYFPNGFWKLHNDEIFVDAGAYNGDTLAQFIDKTKGRFNKYIALEPDGRNFKDLLSSIPPKFKHRVVAIKAGVGDKSGYVGFNSTGQLTATVNKTGIDKIRILALDDLSEALGSTIIKIDVEGYEPEVIKGCKKMLSSTKPKLAVSIYHKPWHLWSLLQQIKKINPNYRFYIRHHLPEIYDTVLYAV
jgi:FkbM family methyltransferase